VSCRGAALRAANRLEARNGGSRVSSSSWFPERVGEQRGSAVQVAGIAIAEGLGARIQQLAVDDLSDRQYVITRRAFVQEPAFEKGQAVSQHGHAEAARRPFCLRQGILAGRIAEARRQVQLLLLQHVDAEGVPLFQQAIG
jgi:hypothetical protein